MGGKMMRGRRRLTLVFALLVIGCGAFGLAYAAIPGANGMIQGCYDGGGNLKVVHTLPCPKGNTPLAWNQQGQQGLKGDKGDPGIAGAAATTYYNEHSHVVEGDGHQEIAGLSGLPAGNYFISVSVRNTGYVTENDVHNSDMSCGVNLRGSGGSFIDGVGFGVEVNGHRTHAWTKALPAGATVFVDCGLVDGGIFQDDATLATAYVTAMKVGALNP